MRSRERLEALSDATVRYCGGPFACARGAPASTRSGDLVGVAEDRVAQERMRRTASCSASAPSRPTPLRRGMERLAEAIEAARRA